jgi:predicted phosphoribosyltransferase
VFLNRREAGKLLAARVASQFPVSNPVVLGLPRGGVPVAYEVARALCAPLNPFLVRPVRIPQRRDVTVGVVASGAIRLLDAEILRRERLSPSEAALAARLREMGLIRQELAYMGGAHPAAIPDRTVMLVNDGMSSGTTMQTAITALRERRPAEILVAVPVASPAALKRIQPLADGVVCLWAPSPFDSIDSCYEYYAPTTDGEVRELLALSREGAPGPGAPLRQEEIVFTTH